MKAEQTIIRIHTPHIKLGEFLKLCGAAQTGGEAKALITAGKAEVNGEVCLIRGKKLPPGTQVTVNNSKFIIHNA